jgi:hypothetical protein
LSTRRGSRLSAYLCKLHPSDHAFPRSHQYVDGCRKEQVEVVGRQALLITSRNRESEDETSVSV